MKIDKLKENIHPSDSDFVKFKAMGNVSEILFQTKSSQLGSIINPTHRNRIYASYGGVITKCDKDHYINNRTGEYKEFNHFHTRADDIASVKKSMAHGRDVINTNVTNPERCKWITLTYADNMKDSKKLSNDFKNFNTRLRQIIGPYEYITAAEPQGRGAWHLHVIMIFKDEAPFVLNELITHAWKQGIVYINDLTDVDNIGVYLTSHLSDIELAEAEELGINTDELYIKTIPDKEKSKKVVKKARLQLYPPGFNIFRYSKNISKPLIDVITEAEAQTRVNDAKLTYEETLSLRDDNGSFNKILNRRFYNSKRS